MSFDWIRLQLIPLPESQKPEKLLYWNPNTGELLGQGVEDVKLWVEYAQHAGIISGHNGTYFEITEPMHKPTELAAILGQHYWVVPEPVETPNFFDTSASNTPQ